MIKVNAPVDEGIGPLVSALSKIDGLETIESCQGIPENQKAFVLFRFGEWQQCGKFLFDCLLPMIPDDLRAAVCLSLRAYAGDIALASVEVDASAIAALTECVSHVSATMVPARTSSGGARPSKRPSTT